jgi:hypothetical protein
VRLSPTEKLSPHLGVEGEVVEDHGADEGDLTGLQGQYISFLLYGFLIG